MPLVTVVITLLVVGVLLWLVNSYVPMQGTIKGILNAVVVIAVVLWIVNIFGLMHYITQFRIGSQQGQSFHPIRCRHNAHLFCLYSAFWITGRLSIYTPVSI